uniref:Uncharacterized protein n=1 Tax=Lotharella oceanica TaxID=641309 RepID=A0A7S2TT49_9EUKA
MGLFGTGQSKNEDEKGDVEDQLAEEKQEEVKTESDAQKHKESLASKTFEELKTPEERLEWKKIKREQRRRLMEAKYEEDKKVDAVLAEKNAADELNTDKDKPVGYGPGTYDSMIAYLEFFMAIATFTLAIAGIFIATDSYSLKSCGSVKTATDVSFCVKSIFLSNATINEYTSCVGIDTTGCCDSSSDLVKPEADRQACTLTNNTLTCLSSGEFESQCKDSESCPSDVVNAYTLALLIVGCVQLLFGVLSCLRGVGINSVKGLHYLEFYERKFDYNTAMLMASAKRGTTYKQYIMVIIFLPSSFWLIYQRENNLEPNCSSAEAQDGSPWQLPSIVTLYMTIAFSFYAAMMIFTSWWRYVFKVRPEIYNPQVHGTQECKFFGVYLDCRECRDEDTLESSKWCGSQCYYKTGYLCTNIIRCGSFRPSLVCWCILKIFIVISNVIHIITIGFLGTILENFALYRHWIGI